MFGVSFNSKCLWATDCYRMNYFFRNKKVNDTNELTTYLFGERLGGGASGSVTVLKPMEGNQRFKACKGSTDNLTREFKLHQLWENKSEGLSIHPKALFCVGKAYYMIMHKYEHTLLELLQTQEFGREEKLQAICQISKGLSTLHSLQIAHGDLFGTNVMNDAKGRYDIIDFGRSVLNASAEEINSDVENLKDLIFRILSGQSKGLICPLPTSEKLEEKGFDSREAQELIDICKELPSTASEINALFANFLTIAKLRAEIKKIGIYS